MKNKKGFTLIEVLAVLIILSIISLVAVPNVVSMLERNKNKQMILDAKEMLNKFQNYKTLGKCDDRLENYECKYNYNELSINDVDGYGDEYIEGFVSYNLNTKKYNIVLKTEKHCVGKNNSCNITTSDSEEFSLTIDNVYEI